jgi:hypothetical protein
VTPDAKIILPEHNLLLNPETREKIEIKLTMESGASVSIEAIIESFREVLGSSDHRDESGLKHYPLMGNIFCQIMEPGTAAISVMMGDVTEMIFMMGVLWGRISKNKDIQLEVVRGTMTPEDDVLIEKAMKDPHGLGE